MNKLENAIEWNLRVHRVDVRKMIEQGIMSEESVIDGYNHSLESATPADIEFLLTNIKTIQSKLETAEKALKEVLETDGNNQVIAVHDIAEKALKQLRE